jgi:pimeloyl-ACP methyl ester carboxylesterase
VLRVVCVDPLFLDHSVAPPPPEHVGVRAAIATNRSLSEHFERRTLRQGLPDVRLPVLFVHGTRDPLPPQASLETAALIPGARIQLVEDCRHFP